ncbi:ATP-binding protein [Aliiglaciecola sp. 3_MG-2023]|uniref:ATP-binding protein n=1 Tax=Aliiglaciecola sp. 3_MG-2023 TaxID=3062644 RepID=UPI0026E3232E|nr:ATP-binding protein [Aliiglaciecola sp. 3_MG-2023]MDO6691975.1 ATP-binding protein [Aliiglaciecola sp. 3_MG-2023]
MKLLHKFFLAFFITNITLVGLMFVFIYMNFVAGFNHFVEQEEQKHVVEVKQQLVQFYSELGSWEPIRQNTQLWRSIVDPKNNPNEPNPTKQNNSQINPSVYTEENITEQKMPSFLWANLPADLLQTGRRISLYDQHKKVVVGRVNLNENPHVEPILLNNKVIGWIGLVPSGLVENSSVNAFLSAQFNSYFTITLCVILLAFIMAIVLSKHLTKPIKQIVVATNELNKGNYETRVSALTQDELGTLSTNFNDLAYTLEHNQHMRVQWVSDTSHELKTPLTVLRSHLLAVQDGVFAADTSRIKLLINQVDNLNRIVDDLAQLANSDTVNLTYNEVAVDVIELLQQTFESYTARFQERSLTVNSDDLKSALPCTVNGDKDRLQQLFSNLLENTCRYTDNGGQVNMKIHRVDNKLEVIIQDSAPGVLAKDQSKLFDRFYRVEKSRNRNYGGSGLGLSLCKKIVEAHGGDISLQDSPLGGLEIKVTIPVVN